MCVPNWRQCGGTPVKKWRHKFASGRAPGQPRRAKTTSYYFAQLPQAHPSHWQGFSQPQLGAHWHSLVTLEPQVQAAWLQLVQRQVLVVLVFMTSSRVQPMKVRG